MFRIRVINLVIYLKINYKPIKMFPIFFKQGKCLYIRINLASIKLCSLLFTLILSFFIKYAFLRKFRWMIKKNSSLNLLITLNLQWNCVDFTSMLLSTVTPRCRRLLNNIIEIEAMIVSSGNRFDVINGKWFK